MPRGRRHVAGATRGQITCNERHNLEDQGMLTNPRTPTKLSLDLITNGKFRGRSSSRWAAKRSEARLRGGRGFPGFR